MRDNIPWDCLADEMKKKAVDLPGTFAPEELSALSKRNILNAMVNIGSARDDWESHMGGKMIMKPYPEEFLYEWDQAANRFTKHGCRVEAFIFELNEGSRRFVVSLKTKVILRSIWFSNNLSINKIGALWSQFYALVMQKPLRLGQFISSTAIWANVMSLWGMDTALRTKRFKRKMAKKTLHGFQVWIYMCSDDSKHGDDNCNVLLLSDFDEAAKTEHLTVPFQPTFRLISHLQTR